MSLSRQKFSVLYGVLVAALMTIPVIIGAVYEWNVTDTVISRFVITVYGLQNIIHFVLQLIAASFNRKRMNHYDPSGLARGHDPAGLAGITRLDPIGGSLIAMDLPEVEQKYQDTFSRTFEQSYGIVVVGYREDPHYFSRCLQSIRDIRDQDLACSTVFIVVDGNEAEDREMVSIAEEVFRGSAANFQYVNLSNTIHESREDTRQQILQSYFTSNVICISQPQRGKRHAMYSAIWSAIQMKIPYLLFTDSDTWLTLTSPFYLRALLDEDDQVAASTGHVKIYNVCNWLTFLVELKYWFAFNLERAAQSWFGCVSCVSGPLGMYRVSVLTDVVEDWIEQQFLCQPATFGDDRRLTNLILQKGYKVLYTHKAICYTETPHVLIRWFSQQTRWGRSFFREYLLGLTSFHKISWWLAYDLTYLVVYSLFLFVFAIIMFWDLTIRSLFFLLASTIVVAFMRALFAILIERDIKFIFFSYFGIVYFLCLLPLKIWSALTVRVNSWGTSDRKSLQNQLKDVWPVAVWVSFVIYCIVQSALRFSGVISVEIWICIGILSGAIFSSTLVMIYLACYRKLFETQARVEAMFDSCDVY